MKFNFLVDLAEEIKNMLSVSGLVIPTYEQLRLQDNRSDDIKRKILHNDLNNLLIHFFSVYSRRIPIIKWNIHISDKLKNRDQILDITAKLESGQDINCLLSNKVNKLNQTKYADLLRSEWGIYHLHFKESRSTDLLFIYFKDNDAYIIDILRHENPDRSKVTWTNTNLIQIIHDNWPGAIESHIFKNASEALVITTEQRKHLRKVVCNTTVIVSDGTEYLPLGGGFSSSKLPTEAIIQADFLFCKVKELQVLFEDNYDIIKEKLTNYSTKPTLKLRVDDDFNLSVVDSKSKTLINLLVNEEFVIQIN